MMPLFRILIAATAILLIVDRAEGQSQDSVQVNFRLTGEAIRFQYQLRQSNLSNPDSSWPDWYQSGSDEVSFMYNGNAVWNDSVTLTNIAKVFDYNTQNRYNGQSIECNVSLTIHQKSDSTVKVICSFNYLDDIGHILVGGYEVIFDSVAYLSQPNGGLLVPKRSYIGHYTLFDTCMIPQSHSYVESGSTVDTGYVHDTISLLVLKSPFAVVRSVEQSNQSRIQIYDLLGRQVCMAVINTNCLQWRMLLPSGCYFARLVSTNGASEVVKFVVAP
jgi:hypothetical protein